ILPTSNSNNDSYEEGTELAETSVSRISNRRLSTLQNNQSQARSGRSRPYTIPDLTGLRLTNIKLHFLPPNTTAHLQPMDAGIIKCFKSKYKQKYIQHLLTQFEQGEDIQKDAIYYIAESWNEVSETTIMNCWKKTGILSSINYEEIQDATSSYDTFIKQENDNIELSVADLDSSVLPQVN
ncbi:11623_t:CDS:2, partial [Scutellospora calospora]